MAVSSKAQCLTTVLFPFAEESLEVSLALGPEPGLGHFIINWGCWRAARGKSVSCGSLAWPVLSDMC